MKKILQLFTRVYQIYLVQKKGENWLTDHIILNFYLVSNSKGPNKFALKTAINWLNGTRLSVGKAQKTEQMITGQWQWVKDVKETI